MGDTPELQRLAFESIDLRDAFWSLRIESMEDDSSTDSETRDTRQIIKTTEEEKQGSIPGSDIATAIAISLSTAHGNPVVGRDTENKRKRKLKKIKKKSQQCKPPAGFSGKKDDEHDDDKSKRQIVTATRSQLNAQKAVQLVAAK